MNKNILKKTIYSALFLLVLTANGSFANNLDSSNSIEKQLAEITNLLNQNNFRSALKSTEQLLKNSPKFQAGWVIRGDILNVMAGSTSLSTSKTRDKLAYRNEVIKRIENFQYFDLQNQSINYPVSLPKNQKHWLFADLANSRLYVILNDKDGQKVVENFYMSQGYNGADKIREGDNRTPVGVYRITSYLAKKQLENFYGNGAYPISYPNNFDISLGKTGSGIWIHGVPENLFSRPPLASNGCMVLSNNNLDRLSKYIKTGSSFIITADYSPFSDNEININNQKKHISKLTTVFEAWRKDWQSLNTNKYLNHYASSFRSDKGKNLTAWSEHKKKINNTKTEINVKIDDVEIVLYPSDKNKTIYWVNFNQDYHSNNYSQKTTKEQLWQYQNGKWQIIFEGGKSKGR